MTDAGRAARLAAVLAALTDLDDPALWLGEIEAGEARGLVQACWRHRDGGEALEALEARGLAPGADRRRSWACAGCGGRGVANRWVHRGGEPPTCFVDDPCGLCSGGTSPPELPCPSTLVSVASLGVDGWVVAEELARVLGAERVAWHASSAGSLLALAARVGHESPAVFAGVEEWTLVEMDRLVTSSKFRASWPEECPLASEKYRRPWPALRALAGLGVRVVGDAGGLVTLAVEVP